MCALNAMNGAVIAGAATIIAVDVADNKLETAKLFCATHTINSTTTDPGSSKYTGSPNAVQMARSISSESCRHPAGPGHSWPE